MPRLHLDHGAEGVTLAFKGDFAFQPFVDFLNDQAARLFGEQVVFIQVEGDVFVCHAEDGAVHDDRTEFFDEVEGEAGLAGAVHVQEAGVRVEACQDEGALDFAVEDAVSVVEGAVDGVGGAAPFAAGEGVFFGQHLFDRFPVFLRPAAFDAHQFGAQAVDRGRALLKFGVAFDLFEFDEVVERFVGAQAQFFVEGGVGLLAILRHVFEQVRLILQFAHAEGNDQAEAARGVEGLELGAAGGDGAGQAGAVEAGIRRPGAADEVDGDAAFGAFANCIGAQAHALVGDDDRFEVNERRLGDLLLALADDEALAVLAEEGAVLVYEEVLDDHSQYPFFPSISTWNTPLPLLVNLPTCTPWPRSRKGSRRFQWRER